MMVKPNRFIYKSYPKLGVYVMDRVINVGLIGFGLSGRVFQTPIILGAGGYKLKKVYETREDNIRRLKELCPEAEAVSSTEDIFQDKEIELVVVATPNSLHFSLGKRALECGKNVVIEKPFTISSSEADRLIELAEDNDRLLTVYQNRRWDGDFMTVRELVEKKTLGRLVEYQTVWGRFRPDIKDTWREKEGPGCGMLYDLGSHLIDQALVIFGLPQRVFGDLRRQRDNATSVDYFQVVLDYEGLRAELRCSMLMKDIGPRYALYGTEGSFKKYGIDPQEEELKTGKN
jgi:predicted dehydrogenase